MIVAKIGMMVMRLEKYFMVFVKNFCKVLSLRLTTYNLRLK